MIKIVGLGPGNPECMTLAGVNCILSAEVLAGGERNIENAFEILRSVGKEADIETICLGKDIESFIKEVSSHTKVKSHEKVNTNGKTSCEEKEVVVVVSGDPGFYSLLDSFNRAGVKVEAVPGISSYQYLYSKLGLSYKNHRLLSCHVREMDFIKVLEECEGVFLLTDGENTPTEICKKLVKADLGKTRVYVGENLSYENEEIVFGMAEEFVDREFSMLSSVIIEKG